MTTKEKIRKVIAWTLTALTPIIMWFAFNEAIAPGYTYRFWITLDIFANVLLWGQLETISARLGQWELNGSWAAAAFCDVLDVFFQEKDHCILAMETEE